MARVEFSGPDATQPIWAGDFLNREHLVPGGAHLDPSEWSDEAVPSGTAVGRTLAERDAGTGFGPAAEGDEEIFLTAFDVTNPQRVADVELYRHNSIVKENFLPGFGDLAAAVVTALREAYTMTLGAE